MCGRYAASRRPEDLVEEFELNEVPPQPVAPSWNVAPTDEVAVVVERRPRVDSPPEALENREEGVEDAEPDAARGEPRRLLRPVRWGLVPWWADDPSKGSRLINARVETVAKKPAFRRAFAARRCLVPADGYYEWYTSDEPRATDRPKRGVRKQPFFIRPKDGGVLAMAGLYEIWHDRAADKDDPAAWLWTCTILTTTAEDDLGRIHDRMPMLVEREQYDAWLDPSVSDPATLHALLVPAAPGRLEAYAVSPEVNSVRNNGPALVDPIPLEEVPDDAPATDRLF